MNLKKISPIWIQSPYWDSIWIFSGIWAPLMVGGALFVFNLGSEKNHSQQFLMYQFINWIFISIAFGAIHRVTTTYGVLFSPLFQKLRKLNPIGYVAAPILIVLGTIALCLIFSFSIQNPDKNFYYTHYWPYFLLANIFILWEIWHFGAQDYGVLSLYRIRSNQLTAIDRRLDRTFCIFMAFAVNIPLLAFRVTSFPRVWNNLYFFTPFHDRDPRLLAHPAMIALWAGTLAALFMIQKEWRKKNRSFPKIAYYLIVLSYTHFIYFSEIISVFYFFAAYTFHHWMVSIGLFSKVNLGWYRIQGFHKNTALRKYLLYFSPFFILVVIWYFFFSSLDVTSLYPLPPKEASGPSSNFYLWQRGFIFGIFFSINFLHYYFDWCFYRFKEKPVRETVGKAILSLQ